MLSYSMTLASEAPPENPWDSKAGTESKPQSKQYPWPNKAQNNQNRRQGGGNNTPPPSGFDFLNNGFGNQPPYRVIMAAIGIVFVLWILNGLYRVQPEENAVVLRFGQYKETVTNPGLHYHLPWPIETALKPNVMFERRIELGYRGGSYDNSKNDVPEESMMLTGDANIVDLDFVVQWKIADARRFLFNIRDAEGTLKRVAESAMREVLGQNNLQDIITDKREDISIRVKAIMQDILNSYGSGVMVTQVLIQDASVPGPVLDAFEDVIRATQESDTMRNQALRYRNEVTPRAQGEAIRLTKEAEAYKLQIVSQATGDATRFSNIYKAYSEAKGVTRERLYIETWEYVLRNNKAMVIDGGDKVSPLSYLNLNALKQAAAKSSEETK